MLVRYTRVTVKENTAAVAFCIIGIKCDKTGWYGNVYQSYRKR
jgi:hypothetical protein